MCNKIAGHSPANIFDLSHPAEDLNQQGQEHQQPFILFQLYQMEIGRGVVFLNLRQWVLWLEELEVH